MIVIPVPFNDEKRNYIFVVSFLVVSFFTVSITFVESTTFVVSFTVVLSEPSVFFDELQPDAVAPIIAATKAKVKMCFFMGNSLNVYFTIVINHFYNHLLKLLFVQVYILYRFVAAWLNLYYPTLMYVNGLRHSVRFILHLDN